MSELPLEFRREILGPLAAKLRARKATQLLGVGSCGKSNIVRQLARPDVQALYLRDEAPALLYLNVDCQALSDYRDSSVYALLLRELGRKLGARTDAAHALQGQINEWYRQARRADGETFARDQLEDALSLLFDGPIRLLIVLLDDCDDLIRHASPTLLKSFRALRDEHKEQMTYVTVTRRELAHLETRAANQTEMAPEFETFFELFAAHSIVITPYQDDDAKTMLSRLEAREDIATPPLSPSSRSEILRLSGGHAGLIKACYEILKSMGRLPEGDPADYLYRKQLVYAECKKIWQSLEPYEHADLKALAAKTKPEGAGLNPLQKKGLLFKQGNNTLFFFSPLFARFVSEETGAPAPPTAPRLVFDAARGSVTVNAHTTQLKPTEAELFGYLWENRTRACSLGELLNVMLRVDAGAQLQARLERHLYHLAARLNRNDITVLRQNADKSWQIVIP